MKIQLLVLFLVLLFALTRAAVTAAPEAVVDTFGKPLRVGAKYYVEQPPSTPYNRTGLNVGVIGDNCPRVIVVSQSNTGLMVSFTPMDPKKSVVRLSTDLNVAFDEESLCDDPYVWKVDYDGSERKWFVYTGGAIGKPGPKTVKNWFKIEKYEDGYKFVYCPSVCKECKVQCEDIGMYKNEPTEFLRLGLSNKPYKVQFVQA